MSSPLKVVFLDREGVITPKLGDGEYLVDPGRVEIADGVVEALRLLRADGIDLFIVTNQSCIGRGMIRFEEAQAIQRKVIDMLSLQNVPIKDSRLCPHTDLDGCACRKPKPGMILDLCQTYGIDPSESVMIGDSTSDLAAGRAAGCMHSLLVGETGGFSTLREAVDRILNNSI